MIKLSAIMTMSGARSKPIPPDLIDGIILRTTSYIGSVMLRIATTIELRLSTDGIKVSTQSTMIIQIKA
jgi:hypothetical protein